MDSDYAITAYQLGNTQDKVYLHKPTGLLVHDREAFEAWIAEVDDD